MPWCFFATYALFIPPGRNLCADFFLCLLDGQLINFVGYVRKITYREGAENMDELDNGRPP